MGRPHGDPNSSPLRPADNFQQQPTVYPPENKLPDYPNQDPAAPQTYPANPPHFAYQQHPQAGASYNQPPPAHHPQAEQFPPQPVAYPPIAQPYQYYQPAVSKAPAVNYSSAQGVPYQQQQQQQQQPRTYVQAPVIHYGAVVGTSPWTTGLFDCMEDPTNAAITACFPCVTFGQVAEILDNGNTPCATSGLIYGAIALIFAVPCVLSCGYRTKLRAQYGLLESPAPDFIIHCLCEWCTLCQEYRELKNRGLDPGIGWHANMAIQSQQQAAMTPPINQTMNA